MIAGGWSEAVEAATPQGDTDALRMRYGAYRRRQVSRLLHMLPEGAARSLYRRARLEEPSGAAHSDEDPLAMLVRYCERLLPLPPFEVWCDDVRRHPDAHLADLEESVDQPTADRPSTVSTRVFETGGREWAAHLRSFRESGLWRGYISFQEEGSDRVHRTTTIFCERDVGGLLQSFQTFDPVALRAFLRSALP